MRDILDRIGSWYDDGRPFALATVVDTWSSAPRPAGASMAVSESGEVVGSVSGGCVEGTLYTLAQEVLETGVPAVETYGVSGGDAFAVGLTCGGTLRVLVERVDHMTFPDFGSVRAAVEKSMAVAVATSLDTRGVGSRRVVLTDAELIGSLGDPVLDRSLIRHMRGLLSQGKSGLVEVGQGAEHCDPEETVFVESFAPPPSMYVFGAVDFTGALSRAAKLLGFRVVVCDARPVFATSRRFPDADEVIVSWPHRYLSSVEIGETDVLCVLTHDPKFDIPLLEVALSTQARYIGAMGSRTTHATRMADLRKRGVSEVSLKRLNSPIGLDLGGSTPEETAISILAEVIADRCNGSGRRLRDIDTAIHR